MSIRPLAKMDVSRMKRAQIDNILRTEQGTDPARLAAVEDAIAAVATDLRISAVYANGTQYRDALLEAFNQRIKP